MTGTTGSNSTSLLVAASRSGPLAWKIILIENSSKFSSHFSFLDTDSNSQDFRARLSHYKRPPSDVDGCPRFTPFGRKASHDALLEHLCSTSSYDLQPHSLLPNAVQTPFPRHLHNCGFSTFRFRSQIWPYPAFQGHTYNAFVLLLVSSTFAYDRMLLQQIPEQNTPTQHLP